MIRGLQIIWAWLLLLVVVSAQAQAPHFAAGQQYQLLPAGLPPLATVQANQVVVTEFFSLACPHCFAEDPYIEQWLKTKPANVVFQRIPVGFGNPQWIPLAKAYYVALALGKADVLMPAIFQAIHVQGQPLFTESALATFFNQYGVTPQTFREYYNSFSINQQMRMSNQLVKTYGVLGVPTIVVGNQYMTDAGSAGGVAQLMQVVSYLVQLSSPATQS